MSPAIPISWPVAHGWLYSWVLTSVPGYRQVDLGGTTCTVTSGHHRWDNFVADLSTQLFAAPDNWDAVITADGRINIGGTSSVVTWDDRLGWLLGFEREAGASESAATQLVSRFVPPGGIPCLGVTWEAVDVERDRETVFDRSRRHQGYVWGGCRVWRVKATMTRFALDALLTGWCLRGKLTALCSDTTAIGATEPGGALTGYVLGLEGVAWLDSDGPQGIAEASILVATETT